MVWTLKSDDSGTLRTAVWNFTTGASTPSFTPAANSLLYAIINNESTSEPSGITGHGTWSAVANITGGPNLSLWACKVGASPSAAAVAITYAGSERGLGLVLEVSGHDDTDTLANISIQTGSGNTYLGSGGGNIPLSAPLSALTTDSLLLMIGGFQVAYAPTETLATHVQTADAGIFEVYVSSTETGDTTPELTTTDQFIGTVVMAVEVKPAAAGGGGVHQSIDPRKRGRIVL